MHKSNHLDKRISFITMGCAKNEVDSQHMARRLSNAGYTITDEPLAADIVIVNTCSFIQAATEESIEAILDAAGFDNIANGNAHLVVAGCMPARYEGELADELPEVSRFVPCADEEHIVALADELLGVERGGVIAPYEPQELLVSDVSAYVKISDGCDRFCAYCSIPYIRGRYHSFTYEEIELEIEHHESLGVKEIVLIAQDTGRWGDDFEEPSTLASLLSKLAQAHPRVWFRVMYIQPEGVTDELIDVVRRYDNVCSYFDIPLQHCDASILKSMNRSGGGDEFLALISKIRREIPGVTLRTTLIAGYPGETDEQLDAMCSFVEEAELDYVGVFPYSREEGTRAYKLDGQLDDDEKLARAQQVRDTADAVSSSVIAQRVGKSMPVLICGCEEDGQLFGRAMCQAPEVDGVTYLEDGEIGDVVMVEIEDTLLYEMEGKLL